MPRRAGTRHDELSAFAGSFSDEPGVAERMCLSRVHGPIGAIYETSVPLCISDTRDAFGSGAVRSDGNATRDSWSGS